MQRYNDYTVPREIVGALNTAGGTIVAHRGRLNKCPEFGVSCGFKAGAQDAVMLYGDALRYLVGTTRQPKRQLELIDTLGRLMKDTRQDTADGWTTIFCPGWEAAEGAPAV